MTKAEHARVTAWRLPTDARAAFRNEPLDDKLRVVDVDIGWLGSVVCKSVRHVAGGVELSFNLWPSRQRIVNAGRIQLQAIGSTSTFVSSYLNLPSFAWCSLQ